MKQAAKTLFTFFLLTALLSTGAAASGSSAILDAPIVEGKSIAGIGIGQTESQVINTMGKKPGLVEQPPGSDEKMLIYQLLPMTDEQSTSLIITVKNGKVTCVELSDQVAPGRSNNYAGKSGKGFRMGDSIERVAELYGRPSVMLGPQSYWYKDKGIAFFCIGPEAGRVPNSIVVLAPGSELPEYLKFSGLH